MENSHGFTNSPLLEPTLYQRLSLIQAQLQEEQKHYMHTKFLLEHKKRAHANDSQEDDHLTKTIKAVFEAQNICKESKKSHRYFTFVKFNGTKDCCIILSWWVKSI